MESEPKKQEEKQGQNAQHAAPVDKTPTSDYTPNSGGGDPPIPSTPAAPNYTLRRLFATVVVGGALTLGYLGFCHKSEPEVVVKEVVVEKQVEIEKLVEIEKPIDLTSVRNYMSSHPKDANEVLQLSLDTLLSGKIPVNDDNFLVMYKIIRDETELSPALIENMGPKAKTHLRDILMGKYIEKIGSTAKELAEEGYNAVRGN